MEKNIKLSIEIVASAMNIAMLYIGSTTLIGALVGIISSIFWWFIMIRGKLWGLVPGSAAGLAVLFYNFWSAS